MGTATTTVVLASAASKRPVNPVPPGWPKVLAIPKLGVRATVEDIDVRKAADLHAPHLWGDVAWYMRGARPGDIGHAAIFGHLDSYCCPAVFWHLNELNPGDVIQVTYRTGKTLSFRVLWKGVYLNNRLPFKLIYGPARMRALSLLTCAGIFHRDGTGYDHKLMIYTQLVQPTSP